MAQHSVVSLFSGAGGLDLGFVQTGRFRVVFANEILLHAATTYSRNFGLKLEACGEGPAQATPNTVLACDVSQVDFSGLSGAGVDVVIGGPPCQDFSMLRGPEERRRGIEVRRGKLYAHFVRALVALQPKVFVFENVPGLVSANRGMAYKVILEDFSKLNLRWPEVKKAIVANGGNGNSVEGYEIVFSRIVDFSALGVPQKRERLIIIGVRRDLVKNNLKLLWGVKGRIEKVLSGGPWLFRKYPLTPIEAFEGRVLTELDGAYKEVMRKWEGVWEEVGTERALQWKREVWDKLTFDAVKDYLFVNSVRFTSEAELEEAMKQHEAVLRELGYYGAPVQSLKLPDSTTELPEEDPDVVERMRRIPPGENHEFVKGTKWEVKGIMSNIYRRAHPLAPAPTVIAYGGGGTHGYHYDRDRATLTLRERARLQTFPDSFLFHGKKTEIRAQIGEAVPPLASKRIAEAVAGVLGEVS